MTGGGDPPLPPSRTPHSSWSQRPFRRRGAPPPPRGPWLSRRRSPPLSSLRSRHPRPLSHKHQRHLPPSQQHPSPQPTYHHHTPPLPRNLQARLRSPPRSPPSRRPDVLVRPEQLRPQDAVSDRSQDRPADLPLPYRGEPGRPHRVENLEPNSYRPSDRLADSFPPRGPIFKPRPELPPYRSEHIPSHRASSDHYVPYRGVPGPLFRADAVSHRDDMDWRGTGETLGRGDSSIPHSLIRNPARIQKPPRRGKVRRYGPHVGGIGRSTQVVKPESPILSRIGYHQGERAGALRQDVIMSQGARSAGAPFIGKWNGEGGASRYAAASPRVFERDHARRGEKIGAKQGVAAAANASASVKGGVEVAGERPKSSSVSSAAGQPSGIMEQSTTLTKSRVGDRRIVGVGAMTKRQISGASGNGKDVMGHKLAEKGKDVVLEGKLDTPRKSIQITTSTEGGIAAVEMREEHEFTSDSKPGSGTRKETVGEFGAAKEDMGMSTGNSPSPRDKHSQPSVSVVQGKGESLVLFERRQSPIQESTPKANGAQHDGTVRTRYGDEFVDGKTEEKGKVVPGALSRKNAAGVTAAKSRSSHPQSRSLSPPSSPKRLRHAGKATPQEDNQAQIPDVLQTPEQSSLLTKSREKAIRPNELNVIGTRMSKTEPVLNKPSMRAKTSEIPSVEKVMAQSKPEVQTSPQASSVVRKVTRESCASVPETAPSERALPRSSPEQCADAMLKTGAETTKQRYQADSSGSGRPEHTQSRNSGQVEESGLVSKRSATKNGETTKASSSASLLPSFAAMNTKPAAPVLPVVELRAALSSRALQANSMASKNSVDSKLTPQGLRSSLSTPILQSTKSNEEPTTPSTLKLSTCNSTAISRQALSAIPTTSSPVSVPAPAISFLRPSPGAKFRSKTGDSALTPHSLPFSSGSLLDRADPAPSKHVEHDRAEQKANELVGKIHAIEERMRAVERKLAFENGSKSPKRKSVKKEGGGRGPETVADAKSRSLFVLTQAIAEKGERSGEGGTQVSDHPMHASLRLVLTRNQAIAAGSNAVFRPLCQNVEEGLVASTKTSPVGLSSEETRTKVAAEVARRKAVAITRTKDLSREYSALRGSWRRKVKAAWEKKSKEKRDAIRERDRFLVMCTKGQSALLSSRTSSGRMSMKIIPSLTSNGHVHGNTEVDALLADIAAAGGTPGLKEVWSKTLATIPAQNAHAMPSDSTSVFVEDPLADLQSSRAVNPWRFEEKLIFLDKYALYPKNFRKIASFIEHKSMQDCSYFYYLHKLDLGLKQLAKEASTLKRKGVLKSHIVSLAKKRLNCECADSVSFHTSMFLSSSQTSTSPLGQERILHSEPTQLNGTQKGDAWALEKWKLPPLYMTVRKRIVSELVPLDLSDIDEEAFGQAVARYGVNLREVSKAIAMPNKTSSHYREMYRRHKHRLGLDEQENSVSVKFGPMSASPTPSLRQSPRLSPKGFLDSSSTPLRCRMSPPMEPEPIMLDEGTEVTHASKDSGRTGSPSALSPVIKLKATSYAVMDSEARAGLAKAAGGLRSIVKTATWTPEECEKFRQLFKKYRRDWKKIAQHLAPKTPEQVKGYWLKVAHEVGLGYGDNGKISKSEKKRAKRSHSSTSGLGGKQKEERKCSSEKKLVLDYNCRDGENNSSGEIDGILCDSKESLGQGRIDKPLETEAKAAEGSQDIETVEEVEVKEMKDKVKNDTKGVEEGCTAKSDEGQAQCFGKPPLLRSSPVPSFRSVALKDTAVPGKKYGVERGTDRFGVGRGGEICNQDKLRRAAESYGVLELIDEKVKGCDFEKSKR